MKRSKGLQLVDDLVCEGMSVFSTADAVRRTGASPTATANLLKRMLRSGLIERISRGRYAVRQLGVLGTSTAAENLAVAVSAAFGDQLHRIGYRSALDEHDLIAHPARVACVATAKRSRISSLGTRRLVTVIEPETSVHVGVERLGPSWVSGLERALLDAAARVSLVGGAAVLGEAVVAAADQVDVSKLMEFAGVLGWNAALRRLGSVADALEVQGLAGEFEPLEPPKSDIQLEPGLDEATAWRDSRWRVRWHVTRDELASVAEQ